MKVGDDIQSSRNSGIARIRFIRYPSASHSCSRCGLPIRNVTHVKFKDGSEVKLGPECIERFLKRGPTEKRLMTKLQNLIAEWQSARAILDLPEDERPVAIAQNANPNFLFHFISDPAYGNQWIGIGSKVHSPRYYGEITDSNRAEIERRQTEFRLAVEEAKAKYDAAIRAQQVRLGKMVAAQWARGDQSN